jgi:anthranilate/para-aminobenzoate synthase component I
LCRYTEAWIGSGGAITTLSDPVGEWEEMTLKVRLCKLNSDQP